MEKRNTKSDSFTDENEHQEEAQDLSPEEQAYWYEWARQIEEQKYWWQIEEQNE